MKEFICPACGEKVIGKIKSERIREGKIISFYRDVYICPSKRCGEVLGIVDKRKDNK